MASKGGKFVLDSALRAAINVQSSKLPSEVAKSSTALLSSLSGTKHSLPDLPYDYNALERKYTHAHARTHTHTHSCLLRIVLQCFLSFF